MSTCFATTIWTSSGTAIIKQRCCPIHQRDETPPIFPFLRFCPARSVGAMSFLASHIRICISFCRFQIFVPFLHFSVLRHNNHTYNDHRITSLLRTVEHRGWTISSHRWLLRVRRLFMGIFLARCLVESPGLACFFHSHGVFGWEEGRLIHIVNLISRFQHIYLESFHVLLDLMRGT